MQRIILLVTTFCLFSTGLVNVYDNTNYDNSVIPESTKDCVSYYNSNSTNKYNKGSDYYKVIPQLLSGFESIKNDKLYVKPDDMYSGKISIDEEKQHSLYFWKFSKPQESDFNTHGKNDTLVLFINGGPGCSSIDGLLLENGPFRVTEDGSLVANAGSWHMHSDIVYLDQPLGTGFSTKLDGQETDLEFYDADLEADSSNHLIKFLIEYYKIFPKDAEKKLILAGESYAGQYVLHFTNNIWKFNKEVGTTIIDLNTVMLGNAWVDPIEQGSSYLPFFQEQGLFNTDNRLFSSLLAQQEECQKVVNNIDIGTMSSFDLSKCESIMYSFIGSPFPTDKNKCLNVYDYRLEESTPMCGANWPYELPNVGKFFKKEGVEEALHIIDLDDDLDNNDRVLSWTECSNRVGSHLKNEVSAVPAIRFLPQLLEQGLNLYLFNGDKDIICNRLGVENYVKKLFWNGEQFSKKAKWHSWFHEDKQVGQFLKDRSITLINIFNGSHMVPYDKPMESRVLFHIMDLLEADKNNNRVTMAEAEYEINTFDTNLKRESVAYYDSEGNSEIIFREDVQEAEDSEKDNESDDGENQNKINKQEHSLLPSWIIFFAFLALLAYIIKYIFDTILLGNRSVRESSTSRLNGDTSPSERLQNTAVANDLESGLGNSEFDIEMDDTNSQRQTLHDDIGLNKD